MEWCVRVGVGTAEPSQERPESTLAVDFLQPRHSLYFDAKRTHYV